MKKNERGLVYSGGQKKFLWLVNKKTDVQVLNKILL